MNVIITADAEEDLADIHTFIAPGSPTVAEQVLDRLVATFQLLADGALRGPEVRFKNGQRVRRWSVPPYRIYYRRTTTQTVIIRVYHQARRPIERRPD